MQKKQLLLLSLSVLIFNKTGLAQIDSSQKAVNTINTNIKNASTADGKYNALYGADKNEKTPYVSPFGGSPDEQKTPLQKAETNRKEAERKLATAQIKLRSIENKPGYLDYKRNQAIQQSLGNYDQKDTDKTMRNLDLDYDKASMVAAEMKKSLKKAKAAENKERILEKIRTGTKRSIKDRIKSLSIKSADKKAARNIFQSTKQPKKHISKTAPTKPSATTKNSRLP